MNNPPAGILDPPKPPPVPVVLPKIPPPPVVPGLAPKMPPVPVGAVAAAP